MDIIESSDCIPTMLCVNGLPLTLFNTYWEIYPTRKESSKYATSFNK